ncbi:MAG: DUF6325 family protein [Acidimicrobiia bacterium]|jgi:uncharacterized membrane protein
MSLGPIEMIVVGFPENQFTGEIAPALADLVESGIVRVVDLVFIAKDDEGTVTAVELNELDSSISDAYVTLVEELDSLIGEEDIEDFGEQLDPGSSIALLVVEHVWAKSFADAVANSGGVLLDSVRIPREVIDELTA